MNENWKAIPGYEGLYEVSDLGNVKALPKIQKVRKGIYANMPERIKKPKALVNGYIRAGLTLNNKAKHLFIHRLVMFAFHGVPEKNTVVDHINGIKTDNKLSNLRYCTNRQNCTYAREKRVSTSKYVGVFKMKGNRIRKYRASIQVNKIMICLGYYATEIEAHNEYQRALKIAVSNNENDITKLIGKVEKARTYFNTLSL